MGKTFKELKFENRFLTKKINEVLVENGRVKHELHASSARIVELAQEIELLRNGLPFADEAKEALNDADFFTEKVGKPILKKMVEGDVAFSSRFMPSVKFKTFSYEDGAPPRESFLRLGLRANSYYFTCQKGSIKSYFRDNDFFLDFDLLEVNAYEAIPELVPDGMVYDKESDSLVKKEML